MATNRKGQKWFEEGISQASYVCYHYLQHKFLPANTDCRSYQNTSLVMQEVSNYFCCFQIVNLGTDFIATLRGSHKEHYPEAFKPFHQFGIATIHNPFIPAWTLTKYSCLGFIVLHS